MFEGFASVPSIWNSINSWFTPTYLFVFLNLMIITIAFTTSLANQKRNQQHTQNDPQQQPIARSPSLLQRFKSINLYSYRSQDHSFTTHLNLALDSDNHYPPQQTHQTQHLETETHYASQQPIARSPSLLQRFKSINLYSYRSQDHSFTTHLNLALDSDSHYPPQQTHQPQPLETETHYVSQQTHDPETLKTETQYVSQQTHEQETLKTETQFVPEQIFGDEEGDDENQQTMDEIYSQLTDCHVNRTQSDTNPASGEVLAKLREKMRKSASAKSVFKHLEEKDIVETRRPATVRERKAEVDEEVDAKADDFINRFKQQLKLQRLDSILRYRR